MRLRSELPTEHGHAAVTRGGLIRYLFSLANKRSAVVAAKATAEARAAVAESVSANLVCAVVQSALSEAAAHVTERNLLTAAAQTESELLNIGNELQACARANDAAGRDPTRLLTQARILIREAAEQGMPAGEGATTAVTAVARAAAAILAKKCPLESSVPAWGGDPKSAASWARSAAKLLGDGQTVAPLHPLLVARVRGCDQLAVVALQGARAGGEWANLLLPEARRCSKKALQLLETARRADDAMMLSHGAMAVITARSQLNAAAVASQVGRHMEALELGRTACVTLTSSSATFRTGVGILYSVCCSLCRALGLKAVQPSVAVVDDPYHSDRVELSVLAYNTIGAQHEHLAQPGDCLSAYRHSRLLAQQAGLTFTPLGRAVEEAAAAAERRFVGYEPRSLVSLLKDMRPAQRAGGANAHRPGWSSNTELIHGLRLSPHVAVAVAVARPRVVFVGAIEGG